MRPFALIASCSENRVIGRAGGLPWHIPEDLAFFHERTAGAVAIMGRISFETWPRATKEGRRAIVVTASPPAPEPRLQTARSLAEALALAQALPGDIYLCGGQRLFEEGIVHPHAARLYLTLVHATVEGDRTFPEWRREFPREVSRREGADPRWRYTFLTLERR